MAEAGARRRLDEGEVFGVKPVKVPGGKQANENLCDCNLCGVLL